jgi:hypothetical protein
MYTESEFATEAFEATAMVSELDVVPEPIDPAELSLLHAVCKKAMETVRQPIAKAEILLFIILMFLV